MRLQEAGGFSRTGFATRWEIDVSRPETEFTPMLSDPCPVRKSANGNDAIGWSLRDPISQRTDGSRMVICAVRRTNLREPLPPARLPCANDCDVEALKIIRSVYPSSMRKEGRRRIEGLAGI